MMVLCYLIVIYNSRNQREVDEKHESPELNQSTKEPQVTTQNVVGSEFREHEYHCKTSEKEKPELQRKTFNGSNTETATHEKKSRSNSASLNLKKKQLQNEDPAKLNHTGPAVARRLHTTMDSWTKNKHSNFFPKGLMPLDQIDGLDLSSHFDSRHGISKDHSPDEADQTVIPTEILNQSYLHSKQTQSSQNKQRNRSSSSPGNVNPYTSINLKSKPASPNRGGFKEQQSTPERTKARDGQARPLSKREPKNLLHAKQLGTNKILNKTVYLSTASKNLVQTDLKLISSVQRDQRRSTHQAFFPKLDIKINHNINVFIHSNEIRETFNTPLSRSPPHSRQIKLQNRPKRTPDQEFHSEKATVTDRESCQSHEFQTRAQTEPEEPRKKILVLPDYVENLKLRASFEINRQMKRLNPAGDISHNPRASRSLPKRPNLSFTEESDTDKSDRLNLSAIEAGQTSITKGTPSAGGRKRIVSHSVKSKQLNELEMITRSAKAQLPGKTKNISDILIGRGSGQQHQKLVEVESLYKPRKSKELKLDKLDNVLNRGELARRISRAFVNDVQDSVNIELKMSQLSRAHK